MTMGGVSTVESTYPPGLTHPSIDSPMRRDAHSRSCSLWPVLDVFLNTSTLRGTPNCAFRDPIACPALPEPQTLRKEGGNTSTRRRAYQAARSVVWFFLPFFFFSPSILSGRKKTAGTR